MGQFPSSHVHAVRTNSVLSARPPEGLANAAWRTLFADVRVSASYSLSHLPSALISPTGLATHSTLWVSIDVLCLRMAIELHTLVQGEQQTLQSTTEAHVVSERDDLPDLETVCDSDEEEWDLEGVLDSTEVSSAIRHATFTTDSN